MIVVKGVHSFSSWISTKPAEIIEKRASFTLKKKRYNH